MTWQQIAQLPSYQAKPDNEKFAIRADFYKTFLVEDPDFWLLSPEEQKQLESDFVYQGMTAEDLLLPSVEKGPVGFMPPDRSSTERMAELRPEVEAPTSKTPTEFEFDPEKIPPAARPILKQYGFDYPYKTYEPPATGQALEDLFTGVATGTLPKGLGALQEPLDVAVDFWGQYFMTPEQEKRMRAKHPNLMAARFAAASLLLPGVSEKFASPEALQEFVSRSPQEQRDEILGLAAGYMVFGGAMAGANRLMVKAALKYPWLTQPRKGPIKILTESLWFRRLNNRQRGVAIQNIDFMIKQMESAGYKEAEILRALGRHDLTDLAYKRFAEKQKITPKQEGEQYARSTREGLEEGRKPIGEEKPIERRVAPEERPKPERGEERADIRRDEKDRLEAEQREIQPGKEEVKPAPPAKAAEVAREVEGVEAPKFKDTGEAIAFGEKATPEQIKQLKAARKESLQEQQTEATNSQFYREAIEAAEGKVRPREKPKAREPWEMTREDFAKHGDRPPRSIGEYQNAFKTRLRYSESTGEITKLKSLTRRLAVLEKNEFTAKTRKQKDKLSEKRAKLLQEAESELTHKSRVQNALREGKPVPPSVLKDYPELAKPTPKQKAPRQRAAVKPEGVKEAKLAKKMRGRQAVSDKELPSGSRTDAEFFTNITERKSFRTKGLSSFDINIRRQVMEGVIAALHEPQIRDAVIESVPVDVVDALKRFKTTPQEFFHDKTLLKDLLSVDAENAIPIGSDVASSLVRIVAGSTTKIEPIGKKVVIRGDERFSTIRADKDGAISSALEGAEKPSSSVLFDEAGLPVDRLATSKAKEIRHKKRIEKKEQFVKPKAKPEKPKELATEEIEIKTPGPVPLTLKDLKYKPIENKRRHSQLLKRIEEKLRVPIRKGGFRRSVRGRTRAGIYKPESEVIRLAKANNIPTAIHEVGHHIEKLLGLPKKMPQEVRSMAYEGAKDLNREGFAEFLKYYVIDEAKVRREAPQFFKDFEDSLSTQPDLQNLLVEAKQAWNDFQSAPSVAKIGSFVVRGNKRNERISLSRVYTEVKDNLWPIKKAMDYAKEKGAVFKPSEDPYMIARLMRGWARKGNQYIQHGTFQYSAEKGMDVTGSSLVEILKPIEKKGLMELLDIYLISKRATTDPRVVEGFKGTLSGEDFKQAVKDLEPLFSEVSKKLQTYNDELLKFLLDSGRISQDLYKRIKAKNPFYAPLYRVFDDAVSLNKLGQKPDSVFNPIKKLKGSSRDIYSPTESLIYNTYAMINSAERTRLGNAIRKLAAVEGMGAFIDKIPFPLKVTKLDTVEALKSLAKSLEFTTSDKAIDFNIVIDQMVGHHESVLEIIKKSQDPKFMAEKGIEGIENMMAKAGLEPEDMFTLQKFLTAFRPNYKTGPNEVIFYNKGKPELYEIIDNDLYKSVSNINASDINLLIKIMSYPAKWLRAGATTFSPEFGIRNPLRDQMTAWIQSEYGFIPGVDFLRGIFHMMGKTELWQKFNASGAAHSAIVSIDRNYLSKNLKQMFREQSKTKFLRNPLEMIQRISEYTEEATRVGEFGKAVKKLGKDYEAMLQAGFGAREVSLDFGRQGGATARAANLMSAFWNARLEGLDKMVRTFKKFPMGATMKAFLGITVPTLLLWWKQKDDEYYQELPSWRRVLFWNIVIHNDDGSLKFILPIPKPFEYGLIFGSLPEAAMQWAYKEDPEAFKETAKQIGKTLDVLPIPTGAIPIMEWFANRSWFFDRPLVPRGKEELEPVLQTRGMTSETVKLVAEIMNKVPGLKEFASPAKIENLIMGYTASFGRLVLEGGDWALKTFGVVDVPPDPSMKVTDFPGIRAFRVRFPSGNTKSIEQFYNEYTDLKRKWESKKERVGIRGKGITLNPKERLQLGMPPKLVLYEAAAKALSVHRKIANAIYESRHLTPEQKTERLNYVYLSMINVARVALDKERIGQTGQLSSALDDFTERFITASKAGDIEARKHLRKEIRQYNMKQKGGSKIRWEDVIAGARTNMRKQRRKYRQQAEETQLGLGMQ